MVILTELPDNQGPSVTNTYEQVAQMVVRDFEINPAKVTWVEHYPQQPGHKETFDFVEFTIAGWKITSEPTWRSGSKEKVLAILQELGCNDGL